METEIVAVTGKYLVLEYINTDHFMSCYSGEHESRHWATIQDNIGTVETTDNPDLYARENPYHNPLLFVLLEGHIKTDVTTREEIVIDKFETSKLTNKVFKK